MGVPAHIDPERDIIHVRVPAHAEFDRSARSLCDAAPRLFEEAAPWHHAWDFPLVALEKVRALLCYVYGDNSLKHDTVDTLIEWPYRNQICKRLMCIEGRPIVRIKNTDGRAVIEAMYDVKVIRGGFRVGSDSTTIRIRAGTLLRVGAVSRRQAKRLRSLALRYRRYSTVPKKRNRSDRNSYPTDLSLIDGFLKSIRK